jgi:hypothetical protein
MQLQGTITNVKAQSEFNQNKYQFADLVDSAGQSVSIMWVNRDVSQFANQPVTIVDVSDQQNKIQNAPPDKNYAYKIMGTGIEIRNSQGAVLGGQPTGAPQAPQGSFQRQQGGSRPQRAQTVSGGNTEPLSELIAYGIGAVALAQDEARKAGIEMTGELQASVFGSAMYGFKEGRPLRAGEQLSQKAQGVFDAAPVANGQAVSQPRMPSPPPMPAHPSDVIPGAQPGDGEQNPFAGDDIVF